MTINAEWPGYILDIFVSEGEEVEEDQQLMLLEGTDEGRTQFYVHAPEAGKILKILAEDGDYVQEDDELFEMVEAD
ncbi:MAG: acetyl-CoA carboxylase biotin carboxyl carrier protein subunit [Holophagales bacterium]|nr:acetyl-CoA carboxylase biotin carboxyl carrier protein subunit [Holophagales bacterium]